MVKRPVCCAVVLWYLAMPTAAWAVDKRSFSPPLWSLPVVAASSGRAPVIRSLDNGNPAGQHRSGRAATSIWNTPPSFSVPPGVSASVIDRWPLPIRPLESDRKLSRSTRFFTAPPAAYRELVEHFAARFQLPLALILAVMHTESSFQPWARSPKDAMGLMQLVPHKGGVDALRYVTGDPAANPPTRQQLADPEFNILLGTAYLRLVLDQYVPADLPWEIRQDLALAAYNWGPERVVRRLLGASPPTTLSEARSRLDRFAPLETRLYVRRVTDLLALYGGERTLLGAAGWRPILLANRQR